MKQIEIYEKWQSDNRGKSLKEGYYHWKIFDYDKENVRIFWKYELNHVHTWGKININNFNKFISGHCYIVKMYKGHGYEYAGKLELIYDTTEGKLL